MPKGYLDFLRDNVPLQENFVSKLKNFLKSIAYAVLPIEYSDAKKYRISNKYMYLYHGTRPQYVDSIKKEGLRLDKFDKRAKDESDLTIGANPRIFMTNVLNRSGPGFGPGMLFSKKREVVFVLCKVETKFLKWEIACYVYFKDVPVKDLIWQNERKFIEIEKKNKYLYQKKKK